MGSRLKPTDPAFGFPNSFPIRRPSRVAGWIPSGKSRARRMWESLRRFLRWHFWLPLASELERPLPNCLADRLVGGDGVEPFGLRFVVGSQEVNQTQGFTLRSQRSGVWQFRIQNWPTRDIGGRSESVGQL